MSKNEIHGQLVAKGLKACFVVSRFNDFLTKQLLEGAFDCLVRHQGSADNVTVIWVPGANELTMVAQRAAAGGKFDAVIALGAVVQGATRHAELILTQVSRSLSRIATDTGVAVINGVVSADTLEQAIERCGTKAGNKGWTAVQAAIEMVSVFQQLA